MAENQPIAIRNIGSNGVIMSGVVDDFLLPSGAVSDVLNLHFDKIGAAKLRKGVTIKGDQLTAGKNILGIHQFLDEGTGTNDQLLVVNDTTTYYWSGSAWTSIRTGLTADKKARFTNFVDYVFMVNGADAMSTWDGDPSGSFGTTNAVSAPTAYFIDNFRSRVWAANTDANPSRLWYSSIPDTSGNIVWTGDDSSYIDISPGDGEDITGIKRFARALYVFKKNFIYRVYSIHETEPDPQIFVGTYSQESIELAKDGMYWHHPSGIYRLRRGEVQPVEISKPVDDIIKNISRTYYDNVSSWHDDDHVYFSVGDVTLDDGTTINNCVLRYTISTEVWTVYSYAMEFRVGNSYDDGNTIVQIVGDTDGKVYTFNSGNDDNGTDISYRLELGPYTFTGAESETKTIRRIAALHNQGQGVKIGYRIDNALKDEIEWIGELDKEPTFFDGLDITGHKITFIISGSSSGEQFEFQGFEILDIINEGAVS